jgi:hypothetical protein
MNEGNIMRRFIFGCIVGGSLTLGLSPMVRAQQDGDAMRAWFSGAKLMTANRSIRLGYAAGIRDAIEVIYVGNVNQGSIETQKAVKEVRECLQARSGGSLDQFTDFAEMQWRGNSQIAATVLMQRSCQ